MLSAFMVVGKIFEWLDVGDVVDEEVGRQEKERGCR
jgi:hypothetical protein